MFLVDQQPDERHISTVGGVCAIYRNTGDNCCHTDWRFGSNKLCLKTLFESRPKKRLQVDLHQTC